MEHAIDILNKDFDRVARVIGSENFLKGLHKTIKDPTFVRNLSNVKLEAYITLAKLNANKEYSMRQLLKEVCPDVYEEYSAGIILDICGTLESRGNELIKEFVERAAL